MKMSKKNGKKKRLKSCECPTNPAARKMPSKYSGNDSKSDKPTNIKKEKKEKREPKKDNCLFNFFGVSSGDKYPMDY